MTNPIQNLIFTREADGTATAQSDGQTYAAFADLPDLAAHPLTMAQALLHFDPNGANFTIIQDPGHFAEAYKARYAQSESHGFDPNNPDIADFSLPDLASLDAPQLHGGQVVFYATMNELGLPYRVEGPADGSADLGFTPL
jgi:hypothetical protein